MSRDPPLVIELLGQPGVGKSTLVRAVNGASGVSPKSSATDHWSKQSLATKAMHLAKTATDGACLAAALHLVSRARFYDRDSLARLLRLLLKSHWLRSQHGTFLLQEGHLQDLWSILYSSGRIQSDPHLLVPLIRCLYRGTAVHIVLLELSPAATFDRIRGRPEGKSRFDRLDDEQLLAQLSATAHLPRILAEGARLAGLSVEQLDASLSIETTASQLRGILQKAESAIPASG